MDRNQGRRPHETNISAQQHQAQTSTWFSFAYGNKEWATRFKAEAAKRSSATGPLRSSIESGSPLRRPAGFSRSKRLTTPTEFGQVFAQATRSSDRYFTVLSRPNNLSGARLGLTVSRRVARHAVQRNRIKRVAREVFRYQQDLPKCDFVILAKKNAPTSENSVLRKSLEYHLRNLMKRADK